MSDPVSDLLTRLRNASGARLSDCVLPYSRLKTGILEVLKSAGYINSYTTTGLSPNTIEVSLKYVNGGPAITGIRRLSTPGRRLYRGYGEIPRVLNGLGISVLSTSRGILDDRSCRREKLGGELICCVW